MGYWVWGMMGYKNELENLKKPGKTSNPNDPRLKRNAKNKQKTKHSVKTQKSNDEDAICLYCNDVNHNFLTSSEPWVGCQLCGRWAHNACAGVDNEDLEEIHISFMPQFHYPIIPHSMGQDGFS